MPHLKGVEVLVSVEEGSPTAQLVVRLLDPALHDIFLQLCRDIMDAASPAPTEEAAVAIAVARTWRWHHLLKGGASTLLSPERQKGLIGELLVLERYFLPNLHASQAVASWHGPLDEAQDFRHGAIAVESKARSTGASGGVLISSEEQLDDSRLQHLFLHLCIIDQASAAEPQAYTLTDVVKRVRQQVLLAEPTAIERFDALTAAAGFRMEDDYSGSLWIGGERSIYRVAGAFPRLVSHALPAGVSRVEYQLSLAKCEEHLVPSQALAAALKGEQHDG
jgi:hypothetical protein